MSGLSLWRGPIPLPRALMADILANVAARHGITPEAIRTGGRTLAKTRWEAFHEMHESGRSLCEIGRFFGLHHATILYGVRQFERGGIQ